MNHGRSLWKIYRYPVALSVATMAGLSSALLGDHFWDWLSWLLLLVPLIVACYFYLQRT